MSYTATDAERIEKKWQDAWRTEGVFNAEVAAEKKPFFIMDMFPFPSGSGLHVGHPLGFIATDVMARFKRMQGFNVLHTMGFDSFGLPAEQYAIETNTSPQESTVHNIETYKRQIRRLGLGHDERRSAATSDPEFYRWTQWIFIKMFDAYFDEDSQKARPIGNLIEKCENGEVEGVNWPTMTADERRTYIDANRLVRRVSSEVNWCPALGTVLADAEVTDEGRSERGDHPVEKRTMMQWEMQITRYARRLVDDLDQMDWPERIKKLQRNWIDGQTKMRDWTFSRQRYWGEPFPLVYDSMGNVHALPEEMLPVTLPVMTSFAPDTTSTEAKTPLERAEDWVQVELDLGDGMKPYTREVNTMPNWAGSCWYYLHYIRDLAKDEFVSKEIQSYWMGADESKPLGGVDAYIGGAEHAVRHLIYARFWHKVLFDLGHVVSPEPFARLVNQGYVQAWSYRDARGVLVPAHEVVETDGKFFYGDEPVSRHYGKMGKSLKNSVNPDEVCDQFGADAFRMYMMSAGPLETDRAWDSHAPIGFFRMIEKLVRISAPDEISVLDDSAPSSDIKRMIDSLVNTAHDAYSNAQMNTIAAKAGVIIDAVMRSNTHPRSVITEVVQVLHPMIPHVTSEVAEICGIDVSSFPERREVTKAATQIYPVQVGKKVRAKIEVPTDASDAEIEAAARKAVAAAGYSCRIVRDKIVAFS